MKQFTTQQITQLVNHGIIKPMTNPQTGQPITSKEMSQIFNLVGNKETEQYTYNVLNSIGQMRINTVVSGPEKTQVTSLWFTSRTIKKKETLNKLKELADVCMNNMGRYFHDVDFYPGAKSIIKTTGVLIDYDYDIQGMPSNVKHAPISSVEILCDLMSNMDFECSVRHGGDHKDRIIPSDRYLKILQNYLSQQNTNLK